MAVESDTSENLNWTNAEVAAVCLIVVLLSQFIAFRMQSCSRDELSVFSCLSYGYFDRMPLAPVQQIYPENRAQAERLVNIGIF